MKSPYPTLRLEISIAIAKLQAMLQDVTLLEAKELGLAPALIGIEANKAPVRPRAPRPRRAARIPVRVDLASGGDEPAVWIPVPRKRGRPRKVTPPPESSATSLAAGDAGGFGLPLAPEPRITGAGFEPA